MWETSPKHGLQPCAYPTANERERRAGQFIQGRCHAFGSCRGHVKSGSGGIGYSSHKSSRIEGRYRCRVARRHRTKKLENRVRQRWHTSFLNLSLGKETSRFKFGCDVTGAKGGPREGRGASRGHGQPQRRPASSPASSHSGAGIRSRGRMVHSHHARLRAPRIHDVATSPPRAAT